MCDMDIIVFIDHAKDEGTGYSNNGGYTISFEETEKGMEKCYYYNEEGSIPNSFVLEKNNETNQILNNVKLEGVSKICESGIFESGHPLKDEFSEKLLAAVESTKSSNELNTSLPHKNEACLALSFSYLEPKVTGSM